MNWYNNVFNIKNIWNNINNFHHKTYDYIFLVTDDDYNFKKKYALKIGKEKIITLVHSGHRNNPLSYKELNTRFLSNRPYQDWIFPCYSVIKPILKRQLMKDKINVVCIGQNMPRDAETL